MLTLTTHPVTGRRVSYRVALGPQAADRTIIGARTVEERADNWIVR